MFARNWLDFLDDDTTTSLLPGFHHHHWPNTFGSLLELPQRLLQDTTSQYKSQFGSFGAIDIQANDDAYIIEVDVPTDKENIELFLKKNKLLTIRAKREVKREMTMDREGKWMLQDRGNVQAIESRPTTESENVSVSSEQHEGQQQQQQQEGRMVNRQAGQLQQQQQQRDQQPGVRHILKERYYGQFERSFQIPNDADPSKMQTKFENGVLTIILPRVRREESRADMDEEQRRYGERIQIS